MKTSEICSTKKKSTQLKTVGKQIHEQQFLISPVAICSTALMQCFDICLLTLALVFWHSCRNIWIINSNPHLKDFGVFKRSWQARLGGSGPTRAIAICFNVYLKYARVLRAGLNSFWCKHGCISEKYLWITFWVIWWMIESLTANQIHPNVQGHQ